MRSIVFLLLFLIPLFMYSQDTYIRLENGYGKSKFVGGDESGMVDNKTFNLGVIIEQEVVGNMIINEDHGRYYYGLRYRHLQAGSNNSIYLGYESHRYDYLEIPLGVQVDWISLLKHSFVMGTDVGIFGAFPTKVEGERTGVDASPWSSKYERVWFLFGFNIAGYAGLNFNDKVGIKVSRFGQFPFIPIATSTPEDWTGPTYKPQLLTDGGWQFALNYKF